MPGTLLWAYDTVNKKWIPVQVNTSGHLIIKKG